MCFNAAEGTLKLTYSCCTLSETVKLTENNANARHISLNDDEYCKQLHLN